VVGAAAKTSAAGAATAPPQRMATGMVRQGKGAAMTARGVEICVKGNFGMKMPRQADAAAVVVVVVDVAAVGTSGRSRSVR